MKKKRNPYSKRSDHGKAQTNWSKTVGLLSRKEYSPAIVRAATFLEIVSNIVVRKELVGIYKLPNDFVDSLLIWANGLRGKWDQLN